MSATKETNHDIDATVEDTFYDNRRSTSASATDEELGAAATRGSSSQYPSSNNKIGWFIAATVSFLLIIGLSVGMSTRSNGNGSSEVLDATVAEASVADDAPSVPDIVSEAAAADSGNNNGMPDLFDPEPEVDVGDSALLAWPAEETGSPSTLSPITAAPSKSPVTAAPSASPTTGSPTVLPSKSPSEKPTLAPSTSPTNEPTLSPSASPSRKPTPEPSSSPSKSPTPKPTFDFSSWSLIDWNAKPTLSPSLSPTPPPSPPPTAKPTVSPSASPSRKPSNPPSAQPSKQPTKKPTKQPSLSPTTSQPSNSPSYENKYFFGTEDGYYFDDDLKIKVSNGLSVRLIAETGKPVQFVNNDESDDDYHTWTDAAGIVSMNPADPLNSGYVYVVNSEESADLGGGVYGIYFDKDSNVVDYKKLLKSNYNCGGGLSPWNTWVSCEEYDGGQCWQVDAVNERAEKTELGGKGGRFESTAVDNRNPMNPVFWTTEDHEEGALRRFLASGNDWDALHSDGETTFLKINDDNTFEWTDDEDEGRKSANEHFPNSEGIQFHEGKLYFMAKKIRTMFVLDVDSMTYTKETTGKKFYGEGSFESQPDQNLFGPTRKYLYFTEDGGTQAGVHARYDKDSTYFTMFEAKTDDNDETVGIALSPDHRKFYAGIQDRGVIFEFRRIDGLPFE